MIPELRPRGIGEILDVAVALYRARFGRLVALAATVVVPVQILTTLVLLSAQPDTVSSSLTGTATVQSDTRSALTVLAATIVVLFVTYVANAFVIGVCARPAGDAYIGQDGTWKRGSVGGRGALAVLATALLVALSEMLGSAFCGIGLFVVSAFFATAMPAVVLERVRPSAALSRSFGLTKGHFWRVLGLILTLQLLVTAVNYGLTLGVRVWLLASASGTAQVIAQGIAGAITAALTTPLLATAAVALYFDLRIRREAFDVQLLLQRADAHVADALAAPAQ
jgi:hypothetical protein